MARYISLYSGSSGNCSVVEEDGKFIIIDMGKSARLTRAALSRLDLDIKNLQAVFISHEHSDHINGLPIFLKTVKVPVWAGRPTLDWLIDNEYIPRDVPREDLNFSGAEAGPFFVRGFDTPHDSLGCLGFKIETRKGRSMAMATDLGCVPPGVFENLRGAGLSVIEANYDPDMLKNGFYPYYLKKRISSDRGHLSNLQASDAVIRLVEAGSEKIQLCHLSQNNNKPDLPARRIDRAARTLGFKLPGYLRVAVNRRNEITPPTEF